jgi:hypothetical protein
VHRDGVLAAPGPLGHPGCGSWSESRRDGRAGIRPSHAAMRQPQILSQAIGGKIFPVAWIFPINREWQGAPARRGQAVGRGDAAHVATTTRY